MSEKITKIYRSSDCIDCLVDYESELKIKIHPIKEKEVIICKDCYIKAYKKANKK